MECAFCGQPLRPGATFCPSCGETPSSPGALRARTASPAPTSIGEPNPRAALLLFAMPTVVMIGVVAFQIFSGFGAASVFSILTYLVVGSVIGGVALAVRRGAAWARWLSFLATLAWGAFMVFTIPDQVGMLRDPFIANLPSLRESAIFGLVMAALQLLLAVATLYCLAFPRGFSASRRSS